MSVTDLSGALRADSRLDGPSDPEEAITIARFLKEYSAKVAVAVCRPEPPEDDDFDG